MQYDPSSSVVPVVLATLAFSLCLRLANSRQNAYSPDHLKRGAILVRQAIQWNQLSEQDEDVMVASQHADYAVAYLNAARATLSDSVLEQVAKVNIYALNEVVEAAQRKKSAALGADCAVANAPSAPTWTRV